LVAQRPVTERPITIEEPAPGLFLHQPKRGFRYSADPFLLAAWLLEAGTPASILDVGTGSGVLALLLAHAGVPEVTGIDVQPDWIPLAQRSAIVSKLRATFAVADVREWSGPRVDVCVSNPPYLPTGRGPLPADPLRAHARHELSGSLGELIAAMSRLSERVALVLPAWRGDEAAALLSASGRPLVRRCDLDQRLVLLEGRASGGPLQREQVVLWQEGGGHGPRVRAWYARLGARLAAAPDATT
jgi:tRNA1Val (adenine37-N6)-methyltransferase